MRVGLLAVGRRAPRRPLALRRHVARWHDVASPGRLGDPDAAAPIVLRTYLKVLYQRPVATTTATAITTAAIGDGLAQLISWTEMDAKLQRMVASGYGDTGYVPHSVYRGGIQAEAARSKQPTLNTDASIEFGPARLVRFSLLVGVLVGGVGELWFRHALLANLPGWTYEVLLRTAFDQAFFAPAVLAGVVGGTALITTGDADYAKHKLAQDMVHSLGKMWTLWCCSATISYLLVPTPWQPTLAAGTAISWACYVSKEVHLPTMRRGFEVTHAPEHVGAFLKAEQARAQW